MAGDSHEIYLIFFENKERCCKISRLLPSLIGALKVNGECQIIFLHKIL